MLDRKPLILSVDDEPDICEMIKDILEDSEEYDVITVSDSSRAMLLVAQRSPDLVLCDIRMPGMTGLQVLEEIKKHDEDIAVIMVTAVREVQTAMEAVRLGAYDYIVKPLGVDEITIAVARALERRRLVLENRDYQLNLEKKVAQQTEHLEQRIRELTALNTMFQAHLNERYETEVTYDHLASKIARIAEELREVVDEANTRRQKPQPLLSKP